MMRLVVISNRVCNPAREGASPGGMTVGIAGALTDQGGVWLGWSGDVVERSGPRRHRISVGPVDYVTLDLPATDFAGYYSRFSNQLLWPLAHERPDLAVYDSDSFAAYLRINATFADELVRLLRPEDLIWVHDYHLIPLAHAMRVRGVRNPIGFFLHTPFPQPDGLMALPIHDSLADFLNAFDVIGFQTRSDLRRFRSFVAVQSWSDMRRPMHRAVPPRAEVFPVSIETEEFAALAATSHVAHPKLAAAFGRIGPDAAPIIAIDRLDYSKAVPRHFQFMDALLRLHPHSARSASLIQVAPVGREDIPAYRREAELAGRAYANLKRRHPRRTPPVAQFLTEGVDRASLAAACRRSRVGLVTPWRDGMNLVAKEYVAAQDPANPGVLVLSRFAGAADELAAGALLVDPANSEAVAHAIHRALTMDLQDRRRRWEAMMEVLRENDVARWSSRFLDTLRRVPWWPFATNPVRHPPLVAGRSSASVRNVA
jgi:trehalose 6-phosphate synthase